MRTASRHYVLYALLLPACQDYTMQAGGGGVSVPLEVELQDEVEVEPGATCAELPAAASGESGTSTCTPVGDVTWDLVLEWEYDRGVGFAVLPLQDDSPSLLWGWKKMNAVELEMAAFDGATGAVVRAWDPTPEPGVRMFDQNEWPYPAGIRSMEGQPHLGFIPENTPKARALDPLPFLRWVDMETGSWTDILGEVPTEEDNQATFLTDADHDGIPDAHTVFSSYYPTTWEPVPLPGCPYMDCRSLEGGHIVADLEQDGVPEVVTACGVHELGSDHWNSWHFSEGLDRTGLVPSDGLGGFVVFAEGGEPRVGFVGHFNSYTGNRGETAGAESFFIADASGAILYQYVLCEEGAQECGNDQSVCSVADADGDGEPEICVPYPDALRLFAADGTVEWEVPQELVTGSRQPCVMADLDADGAAEVITYAADGDDETFLHLYDGESGEQLAEPVTTRRTDDFSSFAENLMVADIDADGSAEIIVHDHLKYGPIRVYGPADGRWSRTRSVWNQLSYNPYLIREDGRSIAWPEPAWAMGAGLWNAQPTRDGDRPDLAVELTGSCADDCSTGEPQGLVRLAVQVSNLGSAAASAGATVRLETWDAGDAAPVTLATHTLEESIDATWSAAGFLFEVEASEFRSFYALQVESADVDECDRINDRVEYPFEPCNEEAR